MIPQVATLSKQLRDYITTIDPSAAKKPQDQRKRSATFKRNLNGHTRLSIHITDAEAVEIRTLMKKQHEDEPVDAFMKLIRSKARTKVVLNTFKTGTGHLYMVGAGTIPEGSITIDSQRTIDLNDHTHSYAPTEEIRAAVMLLDRHCRYPGCTVDALECDLDHVINHDEGGETSIANLACLCRFHHNIKTEQRIHYSLDANRIATFHFRNGATKTTQPELLPIIRTEKSETRLWGVSLCIHAVNSVRLSVSWQSTYSRKATARGQWLTASGSGVSKYVISKTGSGYMADYVW